MVETVNHLSYEIILRNLLLRASHPWRNSTLFSASVAIHFSRLSFSKQCVQMRRRPYISSTIENLETYTQLSAGLGLSILSAMQALAS